MEAVQLRSTRVGKTAVVITLDGTVGACTSGPVDAGGLAPAFPLDDVRDPTGAGDTFAGGFLGYLAATGNRSPEAMRQAIIFGSVMASFTVEAFSLDRLRILDYKEIEARFKEFKRLTHFEDIEA